jgi:hypothetical protein
MMGGRHRPGVTVTLLTVTFTKKEDIFLLHLNNYISSMYYQVNPFGAIRNVSALRFINLSEQLAHFTPQLHKKLTPLVQQKHPHHFQTLADAAI